MRSSAQDVFRFGPRHEREHPRATGHVQSPRGVWSAAALALRLIDDEAKVAGLVTPGLDSYRAVARRIERVA